MKKLVFGILFVLFCTRPCFGNGDSGNCEFVCEATNSVITNIHITNNTENDYEEVGIQRIKIIITEINPTKVKNEIKILEILEYDVYGNVVGVRETKISEGKISVKNINGNITTKGLKSHSLGPKGSFKNSIVVDFVFKDNAMYHCIVDVRVTEIDYTGKPIPPNLIASTINDFNFKVNKIIYREFGQIDKNLTIERDNGVFTDIEDLEELRNAINQIFPGLTARKKKKMIDKLIEMFKDERE